MKLLELQGRVAHESQARDVAKGFLASLSQGDMDAARRDTAGLLYWFGQPLGASAWKRAQKNGLRLSQVDEPRPLMDLRPILTTDELRELCGTTLEPQDSLWLADVVADGQTVTLALVVRLGEPPLVRAVFEPTALADRLRR